MKTTINRIAKVFCVTAAVALLSACGGATSTVDPFKPTRVIGLGDGYALATNSVVAQVASNFGQSNVVTVASSTAEISDLSTQIGSIPGGLTSTDLVVISIGTNDLKNGLLQANYATKVGVLVSQIQVLLGTAKHVLVMPVLDLSRTPWGKPTAANFSTTATAAFNTEVLTQLTNNFGGRSPNPVIYGDTGMSPISSQFLSMTDATSPIWVSSLNQYDFTHCSTNCTDNTTSLFVSATSDTYLSAAGMQWAGNLLYAATAQGWR